MSDRYGRRGKISLLRRLRLAGAAVLLVGLTGAALLYWTAAEGPDRDAGYEMAGGQVYTVSPEDSKTYIHDMEVFGGRSAVLADGIRRWFEGLWRGRTLAFIVAGGAVLTASGIFLVAARLRLLMRDGGVDEDCSRRRGD